MQGANVLMVDLEKKKPEEKIGAIAAEVKKHLPQGSNVVVESFEANITDEVKFKDAVEKAKTLGGLNRLDIMVCVKRVF